MDKDILQKRIDMIVDEMNVVKANYAKLEGHLEETKYWLSEIIKNENPNDSISDIEDIYKLAIKE